jgi:hypothetical protein
VAWTPLVHLLTQLSGHNEFNPCQHALLVALGFTLRPPGDVPRWLQVMKRPSQYVMPPEVATK